MPRTALEEAPLEEEALDGENYRVAAPDLDRVAKLEQENGQLRDKLRAYEREVYAARNRIRRRRATTAAQTGGTVATVAAVLALLAYAFDLFQAPSVAPVVILLAWTIGAIGGWSWDKENTFPTAPAPGDV